MSNTNKTTQTSKVFCGCGCGAELPPDEVETNVSTIKVGRYFEGGAYRDTDESKLDFVKALSPEVLERYVAYLSSTRLQSDGNYRDWDNWKKGIPKDVYLSSLYRHIHSVWKNFGKEDIEVDLCAVMFNAMGMLFEILKEKESNNGCVGTD